MPDLLPTVFIVLGASALVLTLFWLWQSLRHAFTHVDDGVSVALAAGSQARTSLQAEKAALLLALRDLEADREIGKLSEADFNELNARYRTRARDVLKALDGQLAPHRAEAKALLQGAALAAAAAPDAAPNACPSCATTNDVDAVFCKKCGARLTQEAG